VLGRSWGFGLVALITCLVIAGGIALADPHAGKLRGSIRPAGKAMLEIDYRRIDGARFREYSWTLNRVPLTCEGGPAISRAPVDGSLFVRNKFADGQAFGLTEGSGSLEDPVYLAKVIGRMRGPDRARGIVRVRGSSVPLRGGGHDECDSGRLRWRVTR